MADRTCRDCGGPLDILHTRRECEDMQRADDVPELDRYHLAVIAALIDRSSSSMAAAHRLYAEGLLKPPRATAS